MRDKLNFIPFPKNGSFQYGKHFTEDVNPQIMLIDE
jgi:hypothetical protein